MKLLSCDWTNLSSGFERLKSMEMEDIKWEATGGEGLYSKDQLRPLSRLLRKLTFEGKFINMQKDEKKAKFNYF